MITVSISNQQSHLPVDGHRIRAAVRAALRPEGIARAVVSVAVVDDPAIAALHARFLGDAQPTDVLSFLLEWGDGHLEGEVVVSAQRAAAEADRFGWSPADELLLYVVHGALHLAGYEDTTHQQRQAMRRRERACLARFGLTVRYRAGNCARAGTSGGRPARPGKGRIRRKGGNRPQ